LVWLEQKSVILAPAKTLVPSLRTFHREQLDASVCMVCYFELINSGDDESEIIRWIEVTAGEPQMCPCSKKQYFKLVAGQDGLSVGEHH